MLPPTCRRAEMRKEEKAYHVDPVAEGLQKELVRLIHDQILQVLWVKKKNEENLDVEVGIVLDVLHETARGRDGNVHLLVVAQQVLLLVALAQPRIIVVVVQRGVGRSPAPQQAHAQICALHVLIERGFRLNGQVAGRNHDQCSDTWDDSVYQRLDNGNNVHLGVREGWAAK